MVVMVVLRTQKKNIYKKVLTKLELFQLIVTSDLLFLVFLPEYTEKVF